MKRILSYSFLFCFSLFLIMFTACNEKNIAEINSDKTEDVIYVKDNMLVFQDYAQINQTIISFNQLSFKEKKEWYKKYGIKTYGQAFRDVMEKEDSISDYYSNLPKDQQAYFLTQPQVYSDQYKRALNQGIIKVIRSDDNEYFDLNLIDKKYADFLNLDGKIIIGNNIISINGCEEKAYLNVVNGSSRADLSNMKPVILKTNDESSQKLKSGDPYNWSQTSTPITYCNGSSLFYWNHKKVWAKITGSSHLVISFEGQTSTCASSVYCIFDLEAYAQQKNFWGNYVFGNWSTNVIYDASWTYEHASWNVDLPGDQCLCGYDSWNIEKGWDNFPSYSCMPNPAYMCPTSPYHGTAVGNGCIRPLTPEGIIPYQYGAGGYWWARPISVYNANVIITIDGHAFTFQW